MPARPSPFMNFALPTKKVVIRIWSLFSWYSSLPVLRFIDLMLISADVLNSELQYTRMLTHFAICHFFNNDGT